MKGNTTKEIIELANAFDNGKELEYFCHSIKQWLPYCPTNPSFNFNHYTYRIKPKEKKKIKLYKFLCLTDDLYFESGYYFETIEKLKERFPNINPVKRIDTSELVLEID